MEKFAKGFAEGSKKSQGNVSDNALAKLFGIPVTTVGNWGKSTDWKINFYWFLKYFKKEDLEDILNKSEELRNKYDFNEKNIKNVENFLRENLKQYTIADKRDLKKHNTGVELLLETNQNDYSISLDDIYIKEIKRGKINQRIWKGIDKYINMINTFAKEDPSFRIPTEIIIYEQGCWDNNKWITFFADYSNKSDKYMIIN